MSLDTNLEVKFYNIHFSSHDLSDLESHPHGHPQLLRHTELPIWTRSSPILGKPLETIVSPVLSRLPRDALAPRLVSTSPRLFYAAIDAASMTCRCSETLMLLSALNFVLFEPKVEFGDSQKRLPWFQLHKLSLDARTMPVQYFYRYPNLYALDDDTRDDCRREQIDQSATKW